MKHKRNIGEEIIKGIQEIKKMKEKLVTIPINVNEFTQETKNLLKEIEMKLRGRPKKEIAFDADVVTSFIERLFNIEKEIKTLKQDKEELKEEFKDKVDMKLVANVIRLVKLQLKMPVSEETVSQLEEVIKDKINMVL